MKFLRSTDFSKAVLLTLAIGLPVVLFLYLDRLEIGMAIAMGCLLCSPSDVAGSFRYKFTGIFLAAVLAGLVSVVIGYAAVNLWILFPVLSFLIFSIAYLAVYGFRASLVAFSGLFAVVLSFAKISAKMEMWERGLLITCGGLWYLALSSLWHFMNSRRQTDRLLGGCMELTAKYLLTRAALVTETDRREELKKDLFSLQTELNEVHENLREVLIRGRNSGGDSDYGRKRLLVFIELIDMLELAMANPVNYEKMDLLFKRDRKVLFHVKDLITAMAGQLKEIALKLDKKSSFTQSNIRKCHDLLEKRILAVKIITEKNIPTENLILLQNLYDYQEKQSLKIKRILHILTDLESRETLFLKPKEVSGFLSGQDYELETLRINFNFRSPVFRHSLRLTVVVLIGFAIGLYFSLENAYWIILTIVVIMRPSYGLTRQRTKERMIGTLIGALIAVAVVFTFQNQVVYAVLGLLSLTFAFSLIQRNYKTAAVFITLSIVFIYSLLQPHVLKVIQFRVVDTIIGAVLAGLGNFILWPAWESMGLRKLLLESLRANKVFLHEIVNFYRAKGKLPTSYKLARKKVFLEMGNLGASFQRMKQEPKFRQKELKPVQEIVDLNQTFVSALATLGTYIQNHETTSASRDFQIFVDHIFRSLMKTEHILDKSFAQDGETTEAVEKASASLDKKFGSLLRKRHAEIKAGNFEGDDNIQAQLQEAQLITEQLKWLLSLSERLEKKIDALKLR